MNILKSTIAGAASAVGTHYADVAVNQTPHSQAVYYAVGAGGLIGAFLFRNRSPIAAGVFLGVGLGSAYQGYTRTSIRAPGLMSSMQGLLAAAQAVPRKAIGGIPIARLSLSAANPNVAQDRRAFSTTIAPYGVVPFALAQNATPAGWTPVTTHGVPLKAPWPYGLDADRFAKRPPAMSRPTSAGGLPSVNDIKQLAQEGNDVAKTLASDFGLDTSTPTPTAYSPEDYAADTASFENEEF